MQIYQWMVNNLYGGKGEELLLSKNALHSINLPFADQKVDTAGWENVLGFDYAFKEKAMLFNLPTHGYDLPNSDGSPELDAVLEEMLRGLEPYEDGTPPLMLGWNTPEPDWVTRISQYGIITECTSAARNTSFHAALDPWGNQTREEFIEEGLTQKFKSRGSEYENGKVYLSIVANEGDALKTRTNLNHTAWTYVNPITGSGRTETRVTYKDGKEVALPLTWAMNAYQFKYVPSLYQYYYDTATEYDQFYGGPTGGAGYINLGHDPYLEDYIDLADKYMNLVDMHYAEFWFADSTVITKYAEGVSNLRGVSMESTNTPNEHYMTGETPTIRHWKQYWHWPWQEGYPSDAFLAWRAGSECHINADLFFSYFEQFRDPSKPVFISLYGLESSYPAVFWDELIMDERWDPDLYEVVAIGDMLDMVKKYHEDRGEEPVQTSNASYLTPANFTSDLFWESKYTGISSSGASYAQEGNGVRVSSTEQNGGLSFTAKLVRSVTGLKFRASGTAGAIPQIALTLPSGKKLEFSGTAVGQSPQEYTFDFRAADAEAYEELLAVLADYGDVRITLGGGGAGQNILYEDIEVLNSYTYFQGAASFDSINNEGTATKLENGGVRVETNAGQNWAQLFFNDLRFRPDTKYMKLSIGDASTFGFYRFEGDLNGVAPYTAVHNTGIESTFSGDSGTIYIKLDDRLTSKLDNTWLLKIGTNTPGYIVFDEIAFLTEEEYAAENPVQWEAGAPDKIYEDGRYDVDKDGDGIRDGDELPDITNLRLEGSVLRWDTSAEIERYIINIYDASGTLVTTRISNSGELSLSFLEGTDISGYTFSVYGRSNGRPNSAEASVSGAGGEDEGTGGCSSSVSAGTAAAAAILAAAAVCLLRKRDACDRK